jgi:DNA helicase-2/ATP-dependent DNA helicase PcrA
MDSGRVEGREGDAFSFSDFAVLYRTDAQAEVLCEALARSGIPFQKRAHGCLADLPLIKKITGIMRDETVTALPVELLDKAIASLAGKEDQAEADFAGQALRPVAERCGSLELFMSEIAMGVDVDLWDPRSASVSLLTLHASKGLEFQVVFMVGCEDGILPLRWGAGEPDDVEEERRLFFVGMTRARHRLFLSHAGRRRWRGQQREMKMSPFLRDIEERLLERTGTEARKRKTSSGAEQLSLF